MIGDEQYSVFLPVKADSRRVKEKNFRPFAGSTLLNVKLNQLEMCQDIDKVVVSTNYEDIERFVRGYSKVEIDWRDEWLCDDNTLISDLSMYIGREVFKDKKDDEWVIWTHVTSPLFGLERYYDLCDAIRLRTEAPHDSILGAHLINEYLWDPDFKKPLNYDLSSFSSLWPRTQDLPPVAVVNSSVFAAPVKLFRQGARSVEYPTFFYTSVVEGLDIDTWTQFEMAEVLYKEFKERLVV